MRVTINPLFTGIEHELWALGEFLGWIEPQIEHLRLQDKLRTEQDLKDQGLPWNDPDVEIALQEIAERADNVFPRFLRGPFLMSLWASYESGVVEVAKYLCKAKELGHGLDQAKGKQFVDKAERFFNSELGQPLDSDHQRLTRIGDLLQIRNAFAHANGQMRALGRRKRTRLEATLARRRIDVVDGYIRLTPGYLSEAFIDVDGSLRALTYRVRGGPVVSRGESD